MTGTSLAVVENAPGASLSPHRGPVVHAGEDAAAHRRHTGAGEQDSELLAAALRALTASSYAEVRTITVTGHEGLVILHGRVSRYYYLSVAIEAVKKVKGAAAICFKGVMVVKREDTTA